MRRHQLPDDSSVDLQLSEGLDSVGLTQLVTQPTRRLPGAANLLDILAASNISRVTNVIVSVADYISDHCLLSAALAVRLPKPAISYTWRNIRSIDIVSFEDDLRKSVVFSEPATDVDAYVDQLNNVLTELLDKHAPVRTTRCLHPSGSVDGSLMRRSPPSVRAGASNGAGVTLAWKPIESSTDWPVVMLTDQSTAHAETTSDVELKLLAATGRNAGELLMNYFILMTQTNPELLLRTVTCLNRSLSTLSVK